MMLITLVGVGELVVASYIQAEVLVQHIYTTCMNGVKSVNVYVSNIKGIYSSLGTVSVIQCVGCL